MAEPIICPICQKKRPDHEDILAFRNEPKGSELYESVLAYDVCCNPMCNGKWGTNCWHCHHPRFLESCVDCRIFEIAFDTRSSGEYLDRLLQLSANRIINACDTCIGYGPYPKMTQSDWEARCREMRAFQSKTLEILDARAAADLLKVKAQTILECQLAVCEYCRASAESGMTTQHTCIAAPLKEMLMDISLQLYEPEDKLISDLHEKMSIPENAMGPQVSGLKSEGGV